MSECKFRESIHSEPYLALREYLKNKRARSGLTNRELGKKLKTTYSLVSKIESGDRRLDIVEACKYCKEIDADPHELIDLIINKLRR